MMLRPLSLALFLTAACSSSPSTTDAGSDGSTDAPVTGGDASSDASDASQTGDASDAGPSSYTVTFPAQSVSTEQTLCITQRLGNAGPIHVGSIASQLDPGDFQMLVYLSSATTEQTTPQACNPLGGFQGSTLQPIYIARASDTLTFPSSVGIAFAANQMVTIELHQFAEAQTLSAGAKVTFGVMSDSSFKNAAALFVQLPANFSVPPGISSINGFNAIPSHMGAANVFAMTGYENVSGTERKAWNAANANDTSTQVYDSTAPFDAPLRSSFATPLTFATGSGIAYQCTYNNTSGNNEPSGATRNDETCMFASYYYPGQGFEICYGTSCLP